jgi:subtilisin family serine protease
VAGPHPEDPTREVFHWYEACDAVQTQTYEIDGIRVSNFVLPLYFTPSEEAGGRNDFLGAHTDKPSLPSFGVAPGGYVGFYDPETGEHETFEPDTLARRRSRAKSRAGPARRAVRYQRTHAPLAHLEDVVGASAPGPWFECFTVEVSATRNAQSSVKSVVRKVLGRGWSVERVADGLSQFDVTSRSHRPDVRRAWDLTYRLRAERRVRRAEPLFAACLPDEESRRELLSSRFAGASSSGCDARAAPLDPEWSLKLVAAPEAWQLSRAKGREPGAGIRVGHPDTGFTLHPELKNVNTELDRDFVDADLEAVDPLQREGLLANPGHGTATGSVIASTEGWQGGHHAGFVTGAAPAAEIVPLRVSPSVVLRSMRNLRRAVDYACEKGFRVISIGLGGLPSWSLHDSIRRATAKGIIVLAAAGNYVRFVVWPARYEEVVAIAACNVERKPWWGSSRGDAVDVTAPGEGVWSAVWVPGGDGALLPEVAPRDGTSYAVATAAGVAALWLAHHDVERLTARYAGAKLARVFKKLIKDTSTPSEHLPQSDYGAGIVNAFSLLKAPLPSAGVQRARRARPRGRDDDPAGQLESLFAGLSTARVRACLAELLGCDEKELPDRLADVGSELVFHLSVDPHLHSAVGAAFRLCTHAAGLAESPQVRLARMQRIRGALSAAGASSRLRALLWDD